MVFIKGDNMWKEVFDAQTPRLCGEILQSKSTNLSTSSSKINPQWRMVVFGAWWPRLKGSWGWLICEDRVVMGRWRDMHSSSVKKLKTETYFKKGSSQMMVWPQIITAGILWCCSIQHEKHSFSLWPGDNFTSSTWAKSKKEKKENQI